MRRKKRVFKKNQWVVLKPTSHNTTYIGQKYGKKLVKLINVVEGFENTPQGNLWNTGLTELKNRDGIWEDEIERVATSDEIFHHLIKSTDIRINNIVKISDNILVQVQDITLFSRANKISKVSQSCIEYYDKHGDHLVITYYRNNEIRYISLPECNKLEEVKEVKKVNNTASGFMVKSDDKFLLNAFENYLLDTGFKLINNKNNYNIISVFTDTHSYYYGFSGKVEIIYYLPNEWNDIINHLKNYENTYKINHWIILKSGFIAKITKIYDTFNYLCERPINNSISISPIHINEIDRKPTPEELYNHLMAKTDIKIGNIVVDEDGSEYIVKSIKLYSQLLEKERSLSVNNFFKKHGDHLVIDYGGVVPLSKCKKIYEQTVKINTDKNIYYPKYNKSNDTYDIGCVKEINFFELKAFKTIIKFCKKHNIKVNINNIGDIQDIHTITNSEHLTQPISKGMIERLINYMEKRRKT